MKRFAVGVALVLSLLAAPLATGEAAAKSHVSVGIGFSGLVYATPDYPAPPVYYTPVPVYAPPPPTYYYPPSTVIVPSPGNYEPSSDDYASRPIYKRSWHHEDQGDDDDD
jgi:hypothetical protein